MEDLDEGRVDVDGLVGTRFWCAMIFDTSSSLPSALFSISLMTLENWGTKVISSKETTNRLFDLLVMLRMSF